MPTETRTCPNCQAVFDQIEELETRPGLCGDCGEAKEDEELDECKEEAYDQIENCHDLAVMRRALAVVKVLVKVD